MGPVTAKPVNLLKVLSPSGAGPVEASPDLQLFDSLIPIKARKLEEKNSDVLKIKL